jgi:signal transduction histidine kinase
MIGPRGATAAQSCVLASECPISHGPCPGTCIFADVMESQRLGVVVFDLVNRALLFVNRSARELFERFGTGNDFASLSELILPWGPENVTDCFHAAEPVRIGDRLLGYTAYRARAFAWVFVRDITEKVRLESIAAAVETMNNIGYVFSGVRHELGNPINSVKAALSVLRANLGVYSEQTVADYLERIAGEVGRVEKLLRSLKTFSLFECPEIQPVNLEAFVSDFGGLVSEEVRRRDIAFSIEVSGTCWVAADPRALQQVFLNLFANAAEALGEGDSRPTIRVSGECADELVILRVSDNGRGMTSEEAQNLFKPFYTSKEKGTGLGLVITRKLLARMGGTISMKSRQGEGATVTVTLPRSRPEAA